MHLTYVVELDNDHSRDCILNQKGTFCKEDENVVHTLLPIPYPVVLQML